jgi:AmmeMemoRadiSam system protein B
MASLPPLRRALDFMPSPDEGHPGLLIRDPLGYSEGMLVCPPALVPFLRFFDGTRSVRDLAAALAEQGAGDAAQEVAEQMRVSLAGAGFLEDEAFRLRQQRKHAAFAGASERAAAHAGSAYPAEPAALRQVLSEKVPAREAAGERPERLMAVAAPHASPDGAWPSYAAAYGLLGPDFAERTFVVLGTSHYGAANRFGLTRKPFRTALGLTEVDDVLVEEIAREGGPAVVAEDYCHAVEHSIELQVVFLQHVVSPRVRIVPILCGPFPSRGPGTVPEQDEGVSRFLAALRRLREREGGRLFFVLGIYLAHVGRRYGDRLRARAGQGVLREVERGDRARLDRALSGDADRFWSRVAFAGDVLNWCGSSPLYTFLRAAAPARGHLLWYEQWQIDPESVVSCAGLAFEAAA